MQRYRQWREWIGMAVVVRLNVPDKEYLQYLFMDVFYVPSSHVAGCLLYTRWDVGLSWCLFFCECVRASLLVVPDVLKRSTNGSPTRSWW